MKIDSHSCALFLAVTRIIHSPTIKTQQATYPENVSGSQAIEAAPASEKASPIGISLYCAQLISTILHPKKLEIVRRRRWKEVAIDETDLLEWI
jgi:hypothetical protein